MNYDTLLDRFKLCNDELVASTALDKAYRTPPTADHREVDLPMIYCMPAAFEIQSENTSTDADIDTVLMHILIAPLDNDKFEASGLSKSIALAETLSDAARHYYRHHRRLHTTTVDPAPVGNLTGLWRGIDFSGRVVVGLIGYDGGRYYGVEFTFRVYSKEAVTRNY